MCLKWPSSNSSDLSQPRWPLLQFSVLASSKWNMNVKVLMKKLASRSIWILLFPSIFYNVTPVINSIYFLAIYLY